MYANLIDVGRTVGYTTRYDDPLTYCVLNDNSSFLVHGSGPATSGLLKDKASCLPCQTYMAEHCSGKWTDQCSKFVRFNQRPLRAGLGSMDPTSFRKAASFRRYEPTDGDSLVRNAIEKKFFVYPDVRESREVFDPIIPTSPTYPRYTRSGPSRILSYALNPHSRGHLHDNDPHIKMMLDNMDLCFDLLVKMYVMHKKRTAEFNSFAGGQRNTTLVSYLKAHAPLFEEYLKA